MTPAPGVPRSAWLTALAMVAMVVNAAACDGSKKRKSSPSVPEQPGLATGKAPRDAAPLSSADATTPASWSEIADLGDAVALVGLHDRVCALRKGGAVLCWQVVEGDDGDTSSLTRTQPFASLGSTVALGGGKSQSYLCAVSKRGAVHCLSADDPKSSPVKVSGVTDAVAVAAHIELACALTRLGALHCWTPGEEKEPAITIKALPVLVSMQMFGMETAGIDGKGGLWRWDMDGGEKVLAARRTCKEGLAYLADDPESYSCTEARPAAVVGVKGLVLQGGAETMDLFHLFTGAGGFYAYTDKATGDDRPINKAAGGAALLPFIESFSLPANTERMLAASPQGCAVTRSGPVHCWGGELFGPTPQPTLMPPPVAIASSSDQLCALTTAGKVMCMSLYL